MSKDEQQSGEEKDGIKPNASPSPVARYLAGFTISAILLIASICIALFFLLNQKEAKRHEPPPNIPSVSGIRLKERNFTIHLPSQGRVQARAQSSIIPEVAGRIISIDPAFKEGGFFKPGQRLLTLDGADYLNAVAKAEATINQLNSKLKLEKIKRADYTNAVAVAQANVAQAKVALSLEKLERSSYSNTVALAKANLAQVSAALKLEEARRDAAIANFKRLGTLERAKPLAKNEPQVAEALANVRAKQVTLDKSLEDLNRRPKQMEADLEAKLKVAQVQLAGAEQDLKRPEQMEADILAQINVAQAQLKQAQRDHGRTQILAPDYPGRITEKRVDIGQFVTTGTVLAIAIATDYADVRLPISNARLEHLNIPEQLVSTNNTEALNHQSPITYPAVKLTAKIGADLHGWQGKIDRAESRYDSASQQLFLIAQVPEPYGSQPALRAGLFVRADITGNTLVNVFVLPRHAVRRGNEVALAIKIKKDSPIGPREATHTLLRKSIEILWRGVEKDEHGHDEHVIVTRSLMDGSVLITDPVEYATDGQELIFRVASKGDSKKSNGKSPGNKKR
tara:strand:+ start:278 stop:1981 length:1704 start_codon:yes stop_codon:yes gene_type:complete